MKAMNNAEVKVLEMVERGEHLHGLAMEIWQEMCLRELEILMEENRDVLERLKNI